MAYTILNSNGTVLTTIQDGTINTTSTSLGLPGRNYAGYGQAIDTNFVQMLENFAANVPPPNPIQGQLWFNTNNNTLCVCPATGTTTASNWLVLSSTSSSGSATFGNITVNGNVNAANVIASTSISTPGSITTSYITVSTGASLANTTLANANVTSTLTSNNITTGSATTTGSLTGVWNISGGAGNTGATALNFVSGGIQFPSGTTFGIKCDNYMYANGVSIPLGGSYSNSNVASYLQVYSGNVGNVLSTGATAFNGTVLSTGANTTAGSITGNWTLTTGSRLQATYADLAERYHSDEIYQIGTVVKVGGVNEITQTTFSDNDDVLGVISNTYAYLMNSEAGNDDSHPPVALVGRVPVRIVGSIKKGNKITTGPNGCAVASQDRNGFGWALEDNDQNDEKLVLCVIR